MAKQQVKKFWKSKTMWINLLVVVGGVLTALADQLAIGGTITAIGLLGIVLRMITKAQIVK